MGTSDRRSVAKWADPFLADFTWSLAGIEPEAFEVVDLSAPVILLTFDCVREP
jgi:hypothetical protein